MTMRLTLTAFLNHIPDAHIQWRHSRAKSAHPLRRFHLKLPSPFGSHIFQKNNCDWNFPRDFGEFLVRRDPKGFAIVGSAYCEHRDHLYCLGL